MELLHSRGLPWVAAEYALQSVTSLVPIMAAYHLLQEAAVWERLLGWWAPWSPVSLLMAATLAVRLVMFFGVNGVYAVLDAYGWCARFKIPRSVTQVGWEQVAVVVVVALWAADACSRLLPIAEMIVVDGA
jgi:hypothetical protein